VHSRAYEAAPSKEESERSGSQNPASDSAHIQQFTPMTADAEVSFRERFIENFSLKIR
jgi:hypothetical protein